MRKQKHSSGKFSILMSAFLPLLLLLVLFAVFLRFGPLGVFKTSIAPIEKAFIQKVTFSPEHIMVDVYNDGPEPIEISQILVNNAYWQFDMKPSTTLKPLQRGTVEVAYPWIPGDPQTITLLSRNGVTFEKEVEAAITTPRFSTAYAQAFILLGIYVGVIPVLLGLLWLPFLRKIMRDRWYEFLLSLTVGLLVFLGFDALSEAFELIPKVPDTFNGTGILVGGMLLAILALSSVSYKMHHLKIEKGSHAQALVFGYLIALGIGLHNLGEGLAIGSAYALGEVALGSSLVIGFMFHNVTEGIAIVAPLTRTIKRIKDDLHHLIGMGLLAGIPTIFGSLIGGFSYRAEFALLFLAIGAGAIFDVVFDILEGIKKTRWLSIFTTTNVLGFLLGLLMIYATGFLVF